MRDKKLYNILQRQMKQQKSAKLLDYTSIFCCGDNSNPKAYARHCMLLVDSVIEHKFAEYHPSNVPSVLDKPNSCEIDDGESTFKTSAKTLPFPYFTTPNFRKPKNKKFYDAENKA